MLKKISLLVCPFLFLAGLAASAATDSAGQVKRTFPKVRKVEPTEDLKVSMAVTAGVASTETRNSALGYGVEVAYQPLIPFSLGLDLGGYVSPAKGSDATLTRTRLLVIGQYNFGGDTPFIRYSWVGARVGPVWDNVANKTDVDLGVAPAIGFDIPLEQPVKFTLGANANYLFVGGAKPDVFALNGVAKYWF